MSDFDIKKFLPFRLGVLSAKLSKHSGQVYRDRYRLSAPEWRVLAVLSQEGPLSVQEVVIETTMDKVRVSRALATLFKRQFIRRQIDAKDRRRSIIDLTEAGRATYQAIVPLVQAFEAKLIGGLSPQERTILEQALSKLRSVAEKV